MSDKENMLQEAVDASQAGNLARARELLLKLLRLDNQEPLYWLLMSTAVESREERIYCLHNVLKLDPENSAAKHDLNLLNAPLPSEEPIPAEPQQQDDWQTSEIAAPTLVEVVEAPTEEPWSLNWILGSLGFGLVLILIGYYAAANGLILNDDGTATLSLTQEATASVPVTLPDVPTVTREIVVAPRDAQELLPFPHTPTPRYVGTPHASSRAFQQGILGFEAGDWHGAIASFEEHLAAFPRDADAAYYIGESNLRLKDYATARAAFERALVINQQFAPAYLGRAQSDLQLGNEDAAILTDLNTALLLDNNLMLAHLVRGEYYLDRNDPTRALDNFSAAEALAPLSPVVHYDKARAYLALENYELALTDASRALQLDVTLMENYPVLAEAHLELGNSAAAIDALQTFLTFRASNGAGWQLLGLSYIQAGNEAQALDAFERALQLDTSLPYASYYRGLDDLSSANYDNAVEFIRVAVAALPDWFEARVALAEALLKSGNAGSAFFEINSSSSLAETNLQMAAFYYWRATILMALGQPDTALPDWQNLLALPAGDVPAEWRAEAQQQIQP
ncbi:MAG: tetratricopeptide repeat protein [Chloroflexi bacterium]|nr:tetratricopeptide repeat protein [Chloroflexota bacterium]MQC27279.1 tetratricopeptide repeat protein [Chloroflexota bacterium]